MKKCAVLPFFLVNFQFSLLVFASFCLCKTFEWKYWSQKKNSLRKSAVVKVTEVIVTVVMVTVVTVVMVVIVTVVIGTVVIIEYFRKNTLTSRHPIKCSQGRMILAIFNEERQKTLAIIKN